MNGYFDFLCATNYSVSLFVCGIGDLSTSFQIALTRPVLSAIEAVGGPYSFEFSGESIGTLTIDCIKICGIIAVASFAACAVAGLHVLSGMMPISNSMPMQTDLKG